MNAINYSRAVAVVLIAALATSLTVLADGIRTAEIKNLAEFGPLLAVYGSKAIAAGFSAGITSFVAYLTVPFKDVNANALKQDN
jgi:PKD repeat protein